MLRFYFHVNFESNEMILVSGKKQKGSPFLEIWEGENGRDSRLHHNVLRTVGSISALIVFRWKFRFNFTHQLGPLYHGETGIQTTILFNSSKTPAGVKNET